MVNKLPAMRETWVWSLCWEDPLEESMATHSNILAWRNPWTEEPGRLQSMGFQRVRYARRNWRPEESTELMLLCFPLAAIPPALNEPTFTKRRKQGFLFTKVFLGRKVFLEQCKWTQWSLGVLCKTSQLYNFIILIISNSLCKKLFPLWSALLGSKIGSDFGGRQISPASSTNWANSWPLLSPLPHLWNLLIVQESSPIQKLFKRPLLF